MDVVTDEVGDGFDEYDQFEIEIVVVGECDLGVVKFHGVAVCDDVVGIEVEKEPIHVFKEIVGERMVDQLLPGGGQLIGRVSTWGRGYLSCHAAYFSAMRAEMFHCSILSRSD